MLITLIASLFTLSLVSTDKLKQEIFALNALNYINPGLSSDSNSGSLRFIENPKIYNIGAVLTSGENVVQFLQVRYHL
jgi:hypothetical protein